MKTKKTEDGRPKTEDGSEQAEIARLRRRRVLQAVTVLRNHNQWRRGETDANPYRPSEIGEAIDVVCGALEESRETEKRRAGESARRRRGTHRRLTDSPSRPLSP